MARSSSAQAIAETPSAAAPMRRDLPPPKVLRPSSIVRALSATIVLWSRLGDETPASFIHRAYRRATWREESVWGRALLCTGLLLWIPAAFALTIYCTLRLGPGVARRTGKSLRRQAFEQLALALRLGIPPLWYYTFEFHDDDKRRRAAEYLYRFETKAGIYEFLRRYFASFETTEALRNKAEFARLCSRHDLPVIAVLAVVERGAIRRLDGEATGLPHRDLFLKPISGSGGRGAAVWRYRGDGTYESDGGLRLDEAALANHLKALSREGAYVLRSYVSNHPDLAAVSPGALSTVRVLTCLDERGGAEVTHAVMRMARRAGAVVDNFHAGGIAAMVDLRTGALGPAMDTGMERDSSAFDAHPLTGEPIFGRRVPRWNEVLDLARRAHAVFSDHVAIGWDIAVLESGPVLVEGNKSPDLDIIQRTHGGPLGNSRFGELLAFHLRRVLECERRPSPS